MESLLTQENINRLLDVARKNLEKDDFLAPVIIFQTKEDEGQVAFGKGMNPHDSKVILAAGKKMREQTKAEPVEALIIANVYALKLPMGKEKPSGRIASQPGSEECIMIQGQNLGHEKVVMALLPYKKIEDKYLFEAPDVHIINGFESSDNAIGNSLLDYFLEPDKAELYQALNNRKLDMALKNKKDEKSYLN